jgi:CRISPR system Cascade subunit CasE
MSYISRLALRQSPTVEALAALINPADAAMRMDAHHRLIWTAFAGAPEATRDFLWRDEGEGRFMVLSPRPPAAADLFDQPVVKPFAPVLSAGDRLDFLLRANATRTIKTDRITDSGKRERAHRDVVMELLHAVPRGERAPVRSDLAEQAGADWMAGQGARHGFGLERVAITGYRTVSLPRPVKGKARHRDARFGVLDLEGTLTVSDPAAFRAKLLAGFGRAKAFGCGLMLIRPS